MNTIPVSNLDLATAALLLRLNLHRHAAIAEFLDDVRSKRLVGDETLPARGPARDALAIDGDFGDLIGFNLRQKLGKGDLGPGCAAAAILKDIEQRDDQQDRDSPESKVFGVTHVGSSLIRSDHRPALHTNT